MIILICNDHLLMWTALYIKQYMHVLELEGNEGCFGEKDMRHEAWVLHGSAAIVLR